MRRFASYDPATGEVISVTRISGNGIRLRNRPGQSSLEVSGAVDPQNFDVVNGQLRRRQTPRPSRKPGRGRGNSNGFGISPPGGPGGPGGPGNNPNT